MANTQAQFGFAHIGYVSGAQYDMQRSVRFIQKTSTASIGFGDPVIRQNATSAYIIQATGSLATAAPIEGIFVGCEYSVSGGTPQFSPSWPGTGNAVADVKAYVIDAREALFQVATLSTALGTGTIGQVVNFTTGTPSTVGGQFSIATVDQATATSAGGTAASALPFKIVGIWGTPPFGAAGNGTDPTTNFNWVVVRFNNQINNTLAGW